MNNIFHRILYALRSKYCLTIFYFGDPRPRETYLTNRRQLLNMARNTPSRYWVLHRISHFRQQHHFVTDKLKDCNARR